MNPWLQALLTIAGTVVVNACVIAYFQGKQTQKVADLVGWVKGLVGDVKELSRGHKNHEGRISHVEGRLGILRSADE